MQKENGEVMGLEVTCWNDQSTSDAGMEML